MRGSFCVVVWQHRICDASLLLACEDLKALLVSTWGPGAMSLGTTAVERTWWPDDVRNVNRTARWATDAWRQYRAVTAWKHDVSSILRKAEEPLRKGRGGRKFQDAVEKTLALLQAPRRSALRLGCLGGKAAASNHVRRPPPGEVCVGHCLQIADGEGEPRLPRKFRRQIRR